MAYCWKLLSHPKLLKPPNPPYPELMPHGCNILGSGKTGMGELTGGEL